MSDAAAGPAANSIAADRKALLLARAELDRVRIQLALLEIRNVISPPARARQEQERRPVAAALIAAAVPLLGAGRLARWLRFGRIAIVVLRIARDWRRGG